MIHTDIIQGSTEWLELRQGKVTGSRIADILPGVKGAYLSGRKNYMSELICEILTGTTADNFVTDAMQRGTELEATARAEYEFKTDQIVQEVGFIDHPTIPACGSSPDGVILESKGGIEVKCPNTAQHLNTLLNGYIDRKYILQMQFLMNCAGLEWVDYVSFDDRLPHDLQLYIKRIEFDKALSVQIDQEIIKFQAELNGQLEAIEKYRGSK